MARLIIFGDPPAVHPLGGLVRLGRHPASDVQVLDANVSKEHCLIEQREDHFVLRDAGSMNGTYLNGALVSGEARLKHLDIIRIGHACARFDDLAGPEDRAPLAPGDGPLLDGKRAATGAATGPGEAAASPGERRPAPRDDELRRRQQEILRELGDEEDPSRLCERALEAVYGLTRAEHGALFVREEPQGALALRASRGGLGSAALLLTEAALAHVLERQALVATFDAEVRPPGASPDAPRSPSRPARRSALAVPLGHRRCHGIVWVEAPSLESLGPADLGFLDLLGRHVGLLLTTLASR